MAGLDPAIRSRETLMLVARDVRLKAAHGEERVGQAATISASE
jgi:hypothetical protein